MSEDPTAEAPWCGVCCSRHARRAECPGQLLATSPERYGAKVTVAAGARNEVYGTLLAEAGPVWRARVLTYPNMLWSVPAGRGTLKFTGKTPQEAEAAALAYIHDHCKRRGYRITEDRAEPESAPVDREYAPVTRPSGAKDERHLRSLPVRYGAEKPTTAAKTSDLSKGGMFILTDRPLSEGREVKLRIEIAGFSVPLRGRVAWTRVQTEPGWPVGMGIQLVAPPPLYVRYVRKLRGEDVPEESDG